MIVALNFMSWYLFYWLLCDRSFLINLNGVYVKGWLGGYVVDTLLVIVFSFFFNGSKLKKLRNFSTSIVNVVDNDR